MSDNSNTYLAIFLGSRTSSTWKAWDALSDADRHTREREGMAAWHAWVDTHKDAVVAMGGPLGKTKRVGTDGINDITNQMAGYTVIRAASHEDAAKMFVNHPHFTIFPGEGIEIMPVLPVPGGV